MTHIFANRAELIPPGETTEDHQKWREEEAAAVEKDRSRTGRRGGLFRGCFKTHSRRPPLNDYIRQPIIRDVEDGVDRCPRCMWELEYGLCESCGYPSESEGWSDSEAFEHFHPEDAYGDGDDMENAVIDALVDGGEMPPGFGREYTPASPSEPSYSSEDDGFSRHYGGPPDDDFRLAMARREVRPRSLPDEVFQDAGTPYDSMQEETDEGSEDDDEVESLNGFIVDYVEEQRHSSPNSIGRVLWDSDEGSEGEEAQIQLSEFSDQGHESQSDDESNTNEGFSIPSPAAQYNLEDASDEGPIPPSRRQLTRRLAAFNACSGDDSSPPIVADRRRRQMNSPHGNTTGDTQIQRNIAHHSRNGRTSGNFNGVPIEIYSDSDAPVPASQPTRRRRVPAPLFSEEDSGAEASSGTATVGRPSPRSKLNRRQHSKPNSRTSNQSSPIMIGSSPRRATTNESENLPPSGNTSNISNRPSLLSVLSGNRPQNGSELSQQAPASIDDRVRSSAPSSSPPSHLPRFSRINRRLSPLPPGSQARSRASGSSRPTSALEEFDRGVRQRQAQKAERRTERRYIKAERDQRRGGDAVGLSSSHGGL